MDKQQAERSWLNIAIRLLKLVRPMLPIMLLSIAMGVVGHLCSIFITIFGGYALLHALELYAPLSLSSIFTAMPVLALVRSVLRYAEQSCNHYIAFRLLAMIRDNVFKALRRLAPAKLETKDKGNLISLITTDIELLEVFYAHTVSPVVVAVLVSLAMVVLLAQYHILLGLIGLCGYLLIGVGISVHISSRGREAGEQLRKRSGALGSTVLDSLRGLRDVLQFAQGENRLRLIRQQSKDIAGHQSRMNRLEGRSAALTNTGIAVYSLLMLFCSAGLYQLGAFSFMGVFIPFIASISSFGPVLALAGLSNSLPGTFAAANRVLDILDEQPQVEEVTIGKDVAFTDMAFRDVSFAYGGEPVLDNFNLYVPPNGILGIQGRSGSGKSTLLRLMMRFWDVDSGRVTISGTNIRRVNTASLRANQSLVTQDTVLFNDSIENNVKIARLGATRAQVTAACKKAAIHDFIMSLPNGYSTNVGELGDMLSGGERQRIGLARAFLHDAPLMLLDEPTSNLDSLNEGAILKALENERAGRTIVMVSHRASALAIADGVIGITQRRNS